MKNSCDRERLVDVLSEELPGRDATYQHLETCADCRETLESLAAEKRVWNSLPRFLPADEADPAESFSKDNLEPLSPDERDFMSLAIENVVQGLDESENPAMLGRIGEYDVLEVIGCGGMGVVLKGYDRTLNRYVAIKTLATHLASNTPARKRFAREAKAAAAVVHPHVVAVHAVEGAAQLPYFVMQFVAGNSLEQRIDAEAPMDLRDILRIGAQAAAGLSAAHQQGLVHRDVKPSNILLENDVERVLLTDFGLARTIDDAHMTHSGVLAGTPQFMSPEQATGRGVDPRSDLFSLGSVLYMMCTGHSPFRADSTMGILRRITDQPHRPVRQVNPDVPVWLEAIIDRLLEKGPEERYQSAAVVSELLSDWLAHIQQPDTIPRPTEPVVKPATPKSYGGSFAWDGLVGGALRWLAVGGFAFLAGVLVILELGKGRLVVESEASDIPIRITQNGKIIKQLTVSQDGASVRVAAGQYVVEVDGDHEDLTVTDASVSLHRGGIEVVRIVRERQSEQETPLPQTQVPQSPGAGNPLLAGELTDALATPAAGPEATGPETAGEFSPREGNGQVRQNEAAGVFDNYGIEVASGDAFRPVELAKVIGSDVGEPLYNEKLKRFKFHLEWMQIEDRYEVAEYFYRLYVDRGYPPVLGAWGDPETNSIVVVGPPDAEQAIRDTLAEWEGRETGIDFQDDASFEAQRQRLRDEQRQQLQRIAQLEAELIDLNRHAGKDGLDRRVKLEEEIADSNEHLEAIERKLNLIGKHMHRFEQWELASTSGNLLADASGDEIRLLSKSDTEIHVHVPHFLNGGTLTLRNQKGDAVAQYPATGKGFFTLSTEDLSSGEYTLLIEDANSSSSLKFTK